MTDKEKKELKDGVISIFKRFNILDHTATIGGLRDDILGFINSLQEEPVSEDLEEAADSYIKTHGEILGFGRQTFKAGAKWQKGQMMAKAIDCEVHQTNVAGIKLDSVEICSDGIMLDNTLYKDGDKVKVIVIKEVKYDLCKEMQQM